METDTSLEKPRLKPCPFCEGEPVLCYRLTADQESIHYVDCKCGVHGPEFYDHRHLAVQGWNKIARRE